MLVIGLIIGVNLGIIFMCILQINRDNKLKVRINNAISVINTQMKNNPYNKSNLIIIKVTLLKGYCTPKDLAEYKKGGK